MEKDLKDQGIEDSEEFQTKFHRILEMKKSVKLYTSILTNLKIYLFKILKKIKIYKVTIPY